MKFLIENPQLVALAAFIAAVLVLTWFASRPHISLTALANVGEGVWEEGQKSFRADLAIGTRYLLGKIGSDAGHIALAGVADIPIGVITDEAAAAEDNVNVDFLGAIEGTELMVASAAIAVGDFVVPAANGQIRTLPVTAGTYYIVGRALSAAAAAGDVVQVVPAFPVQRIV